MECKKCRNTIPDDSKFCPFCGDDIEKQREAQTKEEKKKDKGKSPRWLVVSLAVLCVVLAGLAVCQSFEVRKEKDTITELTDAYNNQLYEIEKYKETISQKEALVRQSDANAVDYRKKWEAAEKKAETAEAKNRATEVNITNAGKYDQIEAFARKQSIGFSSNKFYTKSPVVLMKKGETKTIAVVDKLGGGHRIYFNSSGVADVSWVDESWETETHLKIKAKYTGVSTITITNDYNSEKYGILVIVTD